MQFDNLYKRVINEMPSTAPAPVKKPGIAPAPAPTPSRPAKPNRPSWFPTPGVKPRPKAQATEEEEIDTTQDDSEISKHDLRVAHNRRLKQKNLFR